jgi:hypothetical protein
MTNQQHPITPPEKLVQQLRKLGNWREIITKAYQAGADLELEACVNYIDNNMSGNKAREFRAIRRPKPPSLKEEVRQIIDCLIEGDCLNDDDAVTMLRVLEALPND